MNPSVTLSHAFVQTGIRRTTPRPAELQYALYEELYDWDTLFYDVYRVGPHIVLQGPPMYNFLEILKTVEPFRSAMRGFFPKARYFGEKKRGEIWMKSDANHIAFDSPLGHYTLPVQPNGADRFAGHRVLVTQSKNNEARWIIDWLRFHNRLHGATAAIIYDNGSTIYSADELQATLHAAVPEMDVLVISWPFRYGAQGGEVAAVNGNIPDWDSDFCQIGILQHARFRFLQKARSVMHNDIDELVIGTGGRTVFEAAEASRTGMVKFDGRWIAVATETPIDQSQCRHADFAFDEGAAVENCPPKWCIRPHHFGHKYSWGVHNIFGAKGNAIGTDEFLFRHFRGVTTSWKYERWAAEAPDPSQLVKDNALIAALAATGLESSGAAQPAMAAAAAG